jgi:hypothetical protein
MGGVGLVSTPGVDRFTVPVCPYVRAQPVEIYNLQQCHAKTKIMCQCSKLLQRTKRFELFINFRFLNVYSNYKILLSITKLLKFTNNFNFSKKQAIF